MISRVYPRGKKGVWYFQYTDAAGCRRQKSTNLLTSEADYASALSVANAMLEKMRIGVDPYITFGEALRLYQCVETNPRYAEAKTTGASYGLAYAKKVAAGTQKIEKILENSRCSYLLQKPINSILRLEIKNMAAVLVDALGTCRTSQIYYCYIKRLFSQAADDGIIPVSTAARLKNIKYPQKKQVSLEPARIAWLMSRRDLFPSDRAWWIFSILATTGMRRGELLALSKEQIVNGVLTIDRALKSDDITDIGLPKWNLVRIIPLPGITQEVIGQVPVDADGRLFKFDRQRIQDDFAKIKIAAMSVDPGYREMWKRMTPHTLRHSLNTNLLAEGLSPVLVAEYLSWHHQELIDMQMQYTHLVAKNLRPIATAIDRLYTCHDTTNIVQFQA